MMLLFILTTTNAVQNITIQIFILKNGTNITTYENYSIKVIDNLKGLAILNNSTGSSIAYTNSNGTIILDNHSLKMNTVYYVIVYNQSGDEVLRKSIYTSNYVPIWVREGNSEYPSTYKDIIKTALKLNYLGAILYIGVVLMMIKLFKLGMGLTLSGVFLLVFAWFVYGLIPDNQFITIIITGVIFTITGMILLRFKHER